MNQEKDKRQPNILLIMSDQLTAALTGAYGHTAITIWERLTHNKVRIPELTLQSYTRSPGLSDRKICLGQ